MRISTFVYSALLFVAAAGLSVITAMVAVKTIEDISRADVLRVLSAEGYNWADVDADGLQVFLIGYAPDEATRFTAKSVAGTVVDAARVIDQMTVIETRDVAPPEFRLELLRSATGVSVFGVLPLRFGTEDLISELQEVVGPDQRVSDLLELVEYPAPDNWAQTVRFALAMIADVPSAKFTVVNSRITGDAVVESQDQKKKLETKWSKRKPDDLVYQITLNAPRPVVSPYTFRAVKDGKALKFDACTAQTAVSRAQIAKAAAELGFDGKLSCQLALGRPTDAWPQVVIKAVRTLSNLPNGAVTMTDTVVKLVAGDGTDQAEFERQSGILKSLLPPEYSLVAEFPVTSDDKSESQDFTLVRSPEGLVQLWGYVNSDIALDMVKSVAVAHFGQDKTHFSIKVDPDLSQDWTPQILTSLDAIDVLKKGKAIISQQTIAISGTSENQEAGSELAVLYATKPTITQALKFDITYQAPEIGALDETTPQDCIEEINALLETRKINFEPGSDRVDLEGQKLLDDITDILSQCGEFDLVIAGHTDSQGREEMNRALSQSRANAVLMELQRRRILTSKFVAKGYGEDQPIAPNDTEEGREKNRRIEFMLVEKANTADQPQEQQKAQNNE